MLSIHPDNPQSRLVQQVVEVLQDGGVIAYPTESGYALGCHMGDKAALERIRHIRQLDKNHNFTLMCRDLSEVGQFTRVDTRQFRILKAHLPGAYTFILQATKEVPKRVMHEKRSTIGIRVSAYPIVQALLTELGEPFLSTSLIMPELDEFMTSGYEIEARIGKQVDLVIDAGSVASKPTTVVDLTTEEPTVIRLGSADFA